MHSGDRTLPISICGQFRKQSGQAALQGKPLEGTTEKSQWRAQCKPKRRIQRNQTEEAHQPEGKADECHEFQEIRHKTITVENCKNNIAAMNGDHDEVLCMTVYVKTFNGQTISTQMWQKTGGQKNPERSKKKNKNLRRITVSRVSMKSSERRDDNRRLQYKKKTVEQSATFSLDQDSRPAGCARNVSVSLMNNLLNNSCWKQTHATCTAQHTED